MILQKSSFDIFPVSFLSKILKISKISLMIFSSNNILESLDEILVRDLVLLLHRDHCQELVELDSVVQFVLTHLSYHG